MPAPISIAAGLAGLALVAWQSNPTLRASGQNPNPTLRASGQNPNPTLRASGQKPNPGYQDRVILRSCRRAGRERDATRLGDLAQVAAGRDRHLAVACARAAVTITDELDRDRVLTQELPDDELRAALASWRAIGADRTRWPDVRVYALVVGRGLHAALGPDATDRDPAFDRAARFADAEPMVRRAAIELTRSTATTRAALVAAIADRDSRVAIAAAQALCSVLAFGEPAGPILAATDESIIARIRTLAGDSSLSRAARVDAKRCLAIVP